METITAAARILADLRRVSSSPAILWHNIPRAKRAAAFRLLSKLGLIEVAFVAGSTKNWRLSERGRAVGVGEEFSALVR